jgi:hypothetical protein
MSVPENTVTCYPVVAGAVARPRAFYFAAQQHEIADILSQWSFPDSHGYRVFTRTGDYFELIYRLATEIWEILPIVEA